MQSAVAPAAKNKRRRVAEAGERKEKEVRHQVAKETGIKGVEGDSVGTGSGGREAACG